MSRKIRKGRRNTSTLKKAKPSYVKVILDVPHFEKDVVQWMTMEDKLQMMVYILYYKISYKLSYLHFIDDM
jgi:hypothetical protein